MYIYIYIYIYIHIYIYISVNSPKQIQKNIKLKVNIVEKTFQNWTFYNPTTPNPTSPHGTRLGDTSLLSEKMHLPFVFSKGSIQSPPG